MWINVAYERESADVVLGDKKVVLDLGEANRVGDGARAQLLVLLRDLHEQRFELVHAVAQ